MSASSVRRSFIGLYLTVGFVLLVESARALVHARHSRLGVGPAAVPTGSNRV